MMLLGRTAKFLSVAEGSHYVVADCCGKLHVAVTAASGK